MACIERRPNCGMPDGSLVPEPLTQLGAALGVIGVLFAVVMGIGKAAGWISIANEVVTINGAGGPILVLGTAASVGAISGAVSGLAVTAIVGNYARDRCVAPRGLAECVAGVVVNIVCSFSSGWDYLLPFSAMHDRVDIVAKSLDWDKIEHGGAYVFCTDQAPPRRSALMRCYFHDPAVCTAARGAVIGAGLGALGGVIAGAAAAALIGCSVIIACLFAIFAAAVAAAASTLFGAMIGGHVAMNDPDLERPTDTEGKVIAVGDLVTIGGNMLRREHDQKANVLYWATSVDLHASSSSPRPYSYCDIDEELAADTCPRVIIG